MLLVILLLVMGNMPRRARHALQGILDTSSSVSRADCARNRAFGAPRSYLIEDES